MGQTEQTAVQTLTIPAIKIPRALVKSQTQIKTADKFILVR